MAFNKDDLYLASGTGQLINSWTDPVYKFDSSSFYNWEQDNLPIYDLEDRDDLLHEMAGYPASATAPSIMLTVSDCGVDNKKVFGSVSSAVEALPNTIRQPVIIEVCVSGQLGDLRLENKEFVASGGGIEIINRGFAKVMCGSSTSPSSVALTSENGASDGDSVVTLLSPDTSSTMTDTFSVGLKGARVGNKHATTFTFWNSFARGFALAPEVQQAHTTTVRGIATTCNFSDNNGTYFKQSGSPTANVFAFDAYADNTTPSDDIVIRNPNYQTEVIERTKFAVGSGTKNRAVGMLYNNCLSQVTIKNCTGKVFIRGFCVDGATQADITSAGSQRTSRGFDIVNSEVVVENCTATRCKEAGLHIDNSDVTLSRGFLAFYNYELLTDGSHLNTRNSARKTPGMRAVNSSVTLSSSTEDSLGLPIDSPFQFTRNVIGVDLVNSILKTPDGYKNGKNTAGDTPTSTEIFGSQTIYLQTSLNTEQGILAKSSNISMGTAISSYQNKVGVELVNSELATAMFTIDHNQQHGLLAKNSVFNYNLNAEKLTPAVGFQSDFELNGQHANLSNSQFIPTQVSGMYDVYNRLAFNKVFGVDGKVSTVGSVNPAVVLNDSSYMNAVNAGNVLRASFAAQSTTQGSPYFRPTYGAAFCVKGGSTLDLNGTKNYVTNILGPVELQAQQISAGVYADGGSTINIAGPTSIAQYGVPVLAQNNSTVNFQPHMRDGVLDVSGYGLDNIGLDGANHTKVQLHSSRASLVADKGSVINMKDLGDHTVEWASKYQSNLGLDYPTATVATNDIRYNKAFCTSGGYMQFFANPLVASGTFNIGPQAEYPTQTKNITLKAPNETQVWTDVQLDSALTPTTFSGASFGGMCVRATKGSTVNVLNTKFPCGWLNTSGAYYDLSGTACDLLKIWNIADNSALNASFLMVSGYHPQDMSGNYYGPSAMWTADTGTGLSGAPSSTPDTSGASVLDSYGLGVQTGGELGYYGKTEQENIGPFRIYVSPASRAKYLGYPVAAGAAYVPPVNPAAFVSMGFQFSDQAVLKTGAPYQVVAQGYNTSGDCSSLNDMGATYNNPSSIYQELGFSSHILSLPADQQGQNVASSFFYAKDLLPNDSEHKIWLDESAANTFANAKNGLLGTSNRKKIFSVYRSWFHNADLGFGAGYYGGGAGATDSTDMARGIGSASLFDLDRYL